MAEGLANRDIARRLSLREHTVRNYLYRIFNKLGTSTRRELGLYAIKQKKHFMFQASPSSAAPKLHRH